MKKSAIKNIAKVTFVVILLSFFGLKSKAASDNPQGSEQHQSIELSELD